MSTLVNLCSVAYGDEFLTGHHWANGWTDATDDVKSEVLTNSTSVILRFCKFFDENENEIDYTPTSETSDKTPDWLRQACCYEALYFLDLENDPARPFPLGILGIIKDGKTVFDHAYEPPLFSAFARKILEENGAVVDDPFDFTNTWGHKKILD